MKRTGWLTNAPWLTILARKCPRGEGHRDHEVLAGKVLNADGEWVWKTEEVAAYPQGLCEELAKSCLADSTPSNPRKRLHATAEGRSDPWSEPTRKEER